MPPPTDTGLMMTFRLWNQTYVRTHGQCQLIIPKTELWTLENPFFPPLTYYKLSVPGTTIQKCTILDMNDAWVRKFLLLSFQDGVFQKKNREYNENGIKGVGLSDLNHYLKKLLNSEKGDCRLG